MSAPTISPSLSASCLSAMGAPYTSMATSCGQPSGPSITNLASNTAQLLGSACSTACSTAIAEFAKAGNATCADQKVFVGDAGATAHDLISQFSLISAVGCVKGTDGSYCAVGQINTLTAAGLSSNSANLLTNLVTYAQVRKAMRSEQPTSKASWLRRQDLSSYDRKLYEKRTALD